MPMSFTMTDTQAVSALQLIQQPVSVQLLYSCEGRKGRRGTDSLLIKFVTV
jgi:hypothetical protein